ncbi:hypothetical protein [Stygiolobus azoricus]|uniref:hypothetical protein n=1 Tax=Stygiolobus azoricus TaxID=41675 RepID=UPI001E39FCC2|nr:hypothetical protein [Stygiolobus azoricus]
MKSKEIAKDIIQNVDLEAVKVIKKWTKAEKERIRAAIMELALLSITKSAKSRMEGFKDRHRKENKG